jgi:hypothetical protein
MSFCGIFVFFLKWVFCSWSLHCASAISVKVRGKEVQCDNMGAVQNPPHRGALERDQQYDSILQIPITTMVVLDDNQTVQVDD